MYFKNSLFYQLKNKSKKGRRRLAFLIGFIILFSNIILFFPFKHSQEKVLSQPNQEGKPIQNSLSTSSSERETLFVLRGKIKKGESFIKSLKKANIPSSIAFQIVAHLKDIMDFKLLMPGDTFSATLDKDGNLVYFEYQRGPTTLYIIERKDDNLFGYRKDIILEKKIFRASGTVNSSLFDSINALGEKDYLAINFLDIFVWDIDFFTQCQPGDHFEMIFEKYFDDEKFIKYGHILAAMYKNKKRKFYAFYFKGKKTKQGYYTEKGFATKKAFVKAPLRYTRISSRFSYRRKHPILGGYRPHLAVDYAAPKGTPVWAVGDGIVTFAGWDRGYGYMVAIKHKNGFSTYYGHLCKIARGIRKGIKVKQMQTIGYVGATGLATGPHLDFRVKLRRKFLNPLKVVYPPGKPVDKIDKSAFLKLKQKFITIMGKETPAGSREIKDLPLPKFMSLNKKNNNEKFKETYKLCLREITIHSSY